MNKKKHPPASPKLLTPHLHPIQVKTSKKEMLLSAPYTLHQDQKLLKKMVFHPINREGSSTATLWGKQINSSRLGSVLKLHI